MYSFSKYLEAHVYKHPGFNLKYGVKDRWGANTVVYPEQPFTNIVLNYAEGNFPHPTRRFGGCWDTEKIFTFSWRRGTSGKSIGYLSLYLNAYLVCTCRCCPSYPQHRVSLIRYVVISAQITHYQIAT